MGLMSWVTATAKKSEAAALIQSYYELSKKHGIFPGDPALTANRLVELACNRVPDLPKRWKGKVLAASVLAVMLTEDELPLDFRDHCAMALLAMLQAAHVERHTHSYDEQNMLKTAHHLYTEFRSIVPAESHSVPPAAGKPVSRSAETSHDRARMMDELIKQMRD